LPVCIGGEGFEKHLHRAAEFPAQIPKLMPRVDSGLAGPDFGMNGFWASPKAFLFPQRENVEEI
jgi:hypothetical protein